MQFETLDETTGEHLLFTVRAIEDGKVTLMAIILWQACTSVLKPKYWKYVLQPMKKLRTATYTAKAAIITDA
jgi:ABC-type polar amino acid transport system ATPase subunit